MRGIIIGIWIEAVVALLVVGVITAIGGDFTSTAIVWGIAAGLSWALVPVLR